MTFRRGDFRKNGGKWTGSSKKKGKKKLLFTGCGRETSLLKKSIILRSG